MTSDPTALINHIAATTAQQANAWLTEEVVDLMGRLIVKSRADILAELVVLRPEIEALKLSDTEAATLLHQLLNACVDRIDFPNAIKSALGLCSDLLAASPTA